MNILVIKMCFILDFIACFRSIQRLCNSQGFRAPWWWLRLRGRNMLEWLISNKLSRNNLCILLVYFCLHCFVCFNFQSLGAFEKLQKVSVSFVVLVCPSVLMEQLGSKWRDFHEKLYLIIFQKSAEKIRFFI